MTERVVRGAPYNSPNAKTVPNDLTPRKTMVVVVIVVGCFAVLWPKVFSPMLLGSTDLSKPSPIDKTTGCCDVISETDINTIKIMSQLCSTIIKPSEEQLTSRQFVAKCKQAVLDTCGIDISAVLHEQVRLGQSVKQILDEVRSLNGSLCLKYNFGVAPWTLGVPHIVTAKMPPFNVRQERPAQLRSEMVHPAFRERGRAIPQPQNVIVSSPSRPPPRIVEGRPGPIPGMRPTMGGPGHVVPPPKQGSGSMGLIMPIYTVGIVIFFTYTVMKIIFKKQPEAVGGGLYPTVEPSPSFREDVFESQMSNVPPRHHQKETGASKLVVNAMSALLEEVDQEIEARRKASEEEHLVNGNAVKPQDEQASVKIVGMEMTASCENGKKWSRPGSPVVAPTPPPVEEPQEIYLEGALPAQSQLLVADSATEAAEPNSSEDPAVVLSGKMTLSVISLDSSENGTDEKNGNNGTETRSSSNVSEDFEKIEAEPLEEQINQIIEEAQLITNDVELAKEDEEEEAKSQNEEEETEIEVEEEIEYEEDSGNEDQEEEEDEERVEAVQGRQLNGNHEDSDDEEQLSDEEEVEVEEIIEYVDEEESDNEENVVNNEVRNQQRE